MKYFINEIQVLTKEQQKNTYMLNKNKIKFQKLHVKQTLKTFRRNCKHSKHTIKF